MSEDDGMCENVVRVGDMRLTCDRLLGHGGRHGGVYPGDAGGDVGGRPVDVEAKWGAADRRTGGEIALTYVSPPSNPPTFAAGLDAGYAEGLRDGRRGL